MDKYSFVRNKQTNGNLFTNTMITYEMYSSCIRSFSEDDSKNKYIFLLEIIGKQKGIFKFPVEILEENFKIIFDEMYKRMCRLSQTYLHKNNRNLPSNQNLFEKIIKIFNSLNTDNSLSSITNRLNLNKPLSNTKMSSNHMMSNNPLFNFETVYGASSISSFKKLPPPKFKKSNNKKNLPINNLGSLDSKPEHVSNFSDKGRLNSESFTGDLPSKKSVLREIPRGRNRRDRFRGEFHSNIDFY